MDKQNAKRAAVVATAAAVGSTGGTIGAEAVINNNDVQNETEQVVTENPTHTSNSNHGHSSSHVSPSVEPHVEVVSFPENEEQQNPEPTNSNTINEPVVEPIIPVGPVDPIDPVEPIEPIEVMYGGPYVPTIDPIVIEPEADMYGGPVDPLNNPEDDVLMGVPAIEEEEIPFGDDTVTVDPSSGYSPIDPEDVDYMA